MKQIICVLVILSFLAGIASACQEMPAPEAVQPSGAPPVVPEQYADSFDYPVQDDDPNDNLDWKVVQGFGESYPEMRGYHSGEDWNLVGSGPDADLGKPVYAIGNGQIKKISPLGDGRLGYLVAIEHQAAPGKTFAIPAKYGQLYSYPAEEVTEIISVYVHLTIDESKIYNGAWIKKWASVGTIMNPGGGPHLHFEIRHPDAVPSRDWSMVGDDRNWARVGNKITGYYVDLQKMVDAGRRDPTEFIKANSGEISIPKPASSHPWPMQGQNAQHSFCSPHKGPEWPIIKWVIQFDEPGVSSSPLVSADGTIYLSRQNVDTTSIIAIEPDGNRRELVQVPGIGRLEAIGSQGTLYAIVWQTGKGVILALDCQGRELWRSSLPSPPIEWTWLTDVVIGPDGTVYASCLDIAHGATWLTAVNSEGSKRWSQLGIRSSPVTGVDGTVYTVMDPGKVCAYDGQGKKQWEYDGRTEWSGYYDRVDYSIAIGPDGTVYVLPSMLGVQDASCGRLIALTPNGTKRWRVDIPVVIRSEYEALWGLAVSLDGSLYVLASGTVYKVDPDGTLKRFANDNFCPRGPIVDAEGTIYMAAITQIGEHAPNYKSQVVAFNPDGSEKWRTEPLDFYAIWLAAIAADGTIYARGESQGAGSGVFQPIVAIGESSSTQPVQPPSMPAIAWGKRVSSEFKAKVIDSSKQLGVDVNYLMAAMAFETGGTFDPSVTNPVSGATGLIQFLPSTARNLGTTTDALRSMSAVEQLDYVEKYFLPHRWKLTTPEDVYMAIRWPKAIGQALDYTLFAEPSSAYNQNRGLDLNGDGRVTKAEASAKVRDSLAEGLTSSNRG